ncbi:XRE family transcriptional regulator [Leptolyngbyaceae cyanobacterium CCMR0082]|uniref:XRE family transcriptional regulator n=1 Tax=Adonisia turfae CCMR0082 TaxID=2304604 RepID=A0A6M0SAJ8_9CYAN|nr:helix-turn-helix transcriptional regulator [Adonisia turfae]NEZ65529.1 XRE family transcriptional regulator [Adonisia turfae CCMR0082]
MLSEKNQTPENRMAALLRGVRAEAGLKQTELGALIGVDLRTPPVGQKTISRWESDGTVPGCYLGAIARVCRVDVGRLLV